LFEKVARYESSLLIDSVFFKNWGELLRGDIPDIPRFLYDEINSQKGISCIRD